MSSEKHTNNIHEIPFFFILGRPRSGTTLLRSLLDVHPNVIIPLENSNMIHLCMKYQSRHSKLTEQAAGRFIKDLLKSRIIREQWKLNVNDIRKNLHALNGKNFSFKDMLKTVYYGYRSVHQKEEILVMGDKSPVNSLYARKIIKVFPDAKFIHLVRDYRANLASMLKHDVFSPSASVILMQWTKSARQISNLASRYPGRFLLIRYEDFVNDPAIHLMKICAFLEIPYRAEMLEPQKREKTVKNSYASGFINSWQPSLAGNISTDNIDKWQGELPQKLVRKADFIAGKTGQGYGYQPVFRHFGIRFSCMMLPVKLLFYMNEVNRHIYDRLPYALKPLIRERRFILSREIIHLKHRLFDKE
ncbi:MAG: sulfotransferase [Bacteroidales bacterium]|nr:sulfotransferase [Bacteroidales bacterium]